MIALDDAAAKKLREELNVPGDYSITKLVMNLKGAWRLLLENERL